jgi:hypothetical protein
MSRQIAKRVSSLLARQQQWASGARGLSAAASPDPVYSDPSAPPVNSKDGKVLHPELLNENMRKTQYAVRGELYLKAEELKNAGKPIIFTNGARAARSAGARARRSARARADLPSRRRPRRRPPRAASSSGAQSATRTTSAPSR